MLPGEADAAQHLDAVLGVVDRVVQRQRGGGRGRQRMPGGRLVGGAGGVPGQGGGAFGPADHGGAQVLDRLKRADRAAELPAGAGIVGGRAAAPGRHPGRFGRVQGGRQVADAFGAQAGQEVLRRDDHVGEPDGGQLAREVERGEALDGDAGLARLEQEPRVAVCAAGGGAGGGGEQVAGGPQDRAGLAGHPQRAVRLAGSGQRAWGERDARGGLGLRERREEFLLAAAGEQEAGQRGGQHRAGGQGAGQLLERGGQVGHRAAVQGDQRCQSGGDSVRFQGADQGDGVGALGPVAEGCPAGPAAPASSRSARIFSRSYSQN